MSQRQLTSSIASLATQLRGGSLTAQQLALLSLERIAAAAPLNAFISVNEDECLRQAMNADQRLKES